MQFGRIKSSFIQLNFKEQLMILFVKLINLFSP
jgi:hypothetical protein